MKLCHMKAEMAEHFGRYSSDSMYCRLLDLERQLGSNYLFQTQGNIL